MVRYAARRGVRAIADEWLSEFAEVRHCDYRDVPETDFDAVSSIGLTEHIGVKNYPAYFGFLKSKLRSGGLGRAKVWVLYMAASVLGFERNLFQLHHVLASKVDGRGDDGGLPLRPWWQP